MEKCKNTTVKNRLRTVNSLCKPKVIKDEKTPSICTMDCMKIVHIYMLCMNVYIMRLT